MKTTTTYESGRPEFRDWVDLQKDPKWRLLPLTHVTKSILAGDIIRDDILATTHCKVFKVPRVYLFYGRAGYRVSGENTITAEAACPCCFVFSSALLASATTSYAFDTGAFANRLYKHMLLDEINVSDFSLGDDNRRINKLIAAAFPSLGAYFEGDTSNIASAKPPLVQPWDFLANAYLNLLASPGRNEPDDRVCTVEVAFDHSISLRENIIGVIVPHTMWNDQQQAPFLSALAKDEEIVIRAYKFAPNKSPDFYHALMSVQLREMFVEWGYNVAE